MFLSQPELIVSDQTLQTQKRLFGNTALLLGGEGIAQLANLVFVVALARVFGRELLGAYAFSMSVGALLGVLVTLGTLALVLRQLSREPKRTSEVTGALLIFQLCVALVLILATYAAARLLNAGSLATVVATLVVAYHVLTQVTRLFLVGYMAREKMAAAAALPVVRRILTLLLAGAAMGAGLGAEVALAAMPIAALMILVLSGFLAMRHFGRPAFRLHWPEVLEYLRQARPFFYVVVLETLFRRIGIIYLAVLGSREAVGLFASAERLVSAAGITQSMFFAALFPLVSRLWQSDLAQFAEIVNRAGRLILLLTLPLATVIALFARDIIDIVYGEAFREASALLSGIAWMLAIHGIAKLLATISQAADQQRTLVTSKAWGLAALTLCSVVLVPRYEAAGLVAAFLVGELASAVCNYTLLRRRNVPLMSFQSALNVSGACLVAACVTYLGSDLALWLRVLAVGSAGVAALWIFRALRGHDLAYLASIAASRNVR